MRHGQYANKTHIGETVRANNGMNMTIIRYRCFTDIDIQFEDGTIVEHRNYNAFKNGAIRNPNIVRSNGKANNPKIKPVHNTMVDARVGAESIASNGLKMKVIAYRNANDLDVKFEDGVVITNKSWNRFVSGHIKHPSIRATYYNIMHRQNRIGEKALSLEGEQIEIVKYNSFDNVVVRFPDGYTLDKVLYRRFKENKVSRYRRYELQRNSRVGTTSKMSNGLTATVIRYRSTTDIDIQFEDGVIVQNVVWHNFLHGSIRHPDYLCRTNKKIVGCTKQNNYGNTLKIVGYNALRDITVEFEDGAIVKHASYLKFLDGTIKHPKDDPKSKRLGEVNIARNGLKMEIIDYRGVKDIDIKFENGIVVKHRAYNAFKKGQIRCPVEKQVSKPKERIQKEEICKEETMSIQQQHRLDRVGESKVANNGMSMTIIEYRSSSDIDVQFEDGTIVQHKYYMDFKKGLIGNPNIPVRKVEHNGVKDVTNEAFLKARDKHIGEEITARCGLRAKIIDYKGTRKMTVQFEDGEIVEDISYAQFHKRSIKHPKFNTRRDFYENNRVGEVNTNIQGKQMKIIEYKDCNNVTVQFEDGKIVKNVKYYYFVNGLLD